MYTDTSQNRVLAASLQNHKLDNIPAPPFPDVWKILMNLQQQRPQMSS